MMKMRKKNFKKINGKALVYKFAVCAIFVSLAFVLNLITIIRLPFGGSITLFSMLFIALPGYFFGARFGFTTSLVFSFLNLIVDPYIVHPVQLFLDYFLAFMSFGIVGFFRDKKQGLLIGFVIACIMRFLSSAVSGYVFFKEYAPIDWNPIVYTVVYNGSYIFIECIMTIVLISMKQVSKLIEKFKKEWN